jgi:hypothetical protein
MCTVVIQSAFVIVRHRLQLEYHDVKTLERSHQRAVLDLWNTGTFCLLLKLIFPSRVARIL